jgi:hypothetical protein
MPYLYINDFFFWGDFMPGCLENEGSLFMLCEFIFLIVFCYLLNLVCVVYVEINLQYLVPFIIVPCQFCYLSSRVDLKTAPWFSATCPRRLPLRVHRVSPPSLNVDTDRVGPQLRSSAHSVSYERPLKFWRWSKLVNVGTNRKSSEVGRSFRIALWVAILADRRSFARVFLAWRRLWRFIE